MGDRRRPRLSVRTRRDQRHDAPTRRAARAIARRRLTNAPIIDSPRSDARGSRFGPPPATRQPHVSELGVVLSAPAPAGPAPASSAFAAPEALPRLPPSLALPATSSLPPAGLRAPSPAAPPALTPPAAPPALTPPAAPPALTPPAPPALTPPAAPPALTPPVPSPPLPTAPPDSPPAPDAPPAPIEFEQ